MTEPELILPETIAGLPSPDYYGGEIEIAKNLDASPAGLLLGPVENMSNLEAFKYDSDGDELTQET